MKVKNTFRSGSEYKISCLPNSHPSSTVHSSELTASKVSDNS